MPQVACVEASKDADPQCGSERQCAACGSLAERFAECWRASATPSNEGTLTFRPTVKSQCEQRWGSGSPLTTIRE